MLRLKGLCLVLLCFSSAACSDSVRSSPPSARSLQSGPSACEFVQHAWGPAGSVPLHVDKVITGLEVPWAIAFLPGGDWLVTERPGRIRLVRAGQLVTQAVVQVITGESGEGGLLGLALHPSFSTNNLFYVFYTTVSNGQTINRVERFKLSADHTSATSDRIILDGIPAGTFHDGGRIKFGPDGLLYISAGDGQSPDRAQDAASLNGKILRLDVDGNVPVANPTAGSPIYVSGVRNVEAFDWSDPSTLLIADNGPTGELGLTGRDEVSFARAGDNLGWPLITACQMQSSLITPILSWNTAAPPGGAVIPHNSVIPEFNGNVIIGMLGTGVGSAMQLHRVVFDPSSHKLILHESYLQGQFGRLRDVEQGPDGALYVTTSNCDSRGTCPSEGDSILRITHQ